MQEYGLPKPEFVDERGSFMVRLRRYGAEKTAAAPEEVENHELLLFCKTPRTRKEICEFLGLNSMTYAMQTRVMPLVEQGLIKMSIPDKPKSSKQLFYCE